ncbi:MAG: NAD(P)H-dependent glycerol-3-phosphate dehydrogenase [Pseudorhodobacter sp.]|nr:NAD(P)H-dependent glycerol-3-phosphate dehydrogenase [Pseudorhodobacter sp.]
MNAAAVSVLGAGAFGTALAITLAPGRPVTLWGRDAVAMTNMAQTGCNARYLPGVELPPGLTLTANLAQALAADLVLLAVPMQQLAEFLRQTGPQLADKTLIACCKGVDRGTGLGPVALLARFCPTARAALLTGPSFAADIARSLPTALTLACADPAEGTRLQRQLANPILRLYRSSDVTGAELGGALKNVIAIAAGLVIGAGLGDSARAALMTRGYAEMVRFAVARGAQAQTLAGLSGLGDLVLTCTSPQSRNFAFGVALARGQAIDPRTTIEGVATAQAVADMAGDTMPITSMVALVCTRVLTIDEAIARLMSRPLKEE